MKLVNLDHLPKIVNKFEHERGHELGMKKIWKEKRDLQLAYVLMKTSTFKVTENTHRINFSLTRVKGFHECGWLSKG